MPKDSGGGGNRKRPRLLSPTLQRQKNTRQTGVTRMRGQGSFKQYFRIVFPGVSSPGSSGSSAGSSSGGGSSAGGGGHAWGSNAPSTGHQVVPRSEEVSQRPRRSRRVAKRKR